MSNHNIRLAPGQTCMIVESMFTGVPNLGRHWVELMWDSPAIVTILCQPWLGVIPTMIPKANLINLCWGWLIGYHEGKSLWGNAGIFFRRWMGNKSHQRRKSDINSSAVLPRCQLNSKWNLWPKSLANKCRSLLSPRCKCSVVAPPQSSRQFLPKYGFIIGQKLRHYVDTLMSAVQWYSHDIPIICCLTLHN
jgi:hypothetical protein